VDETLLGGELHFSNLHIFTNLIADEKAMPGKAYRLLLIT
jgi:hypothetical protein